MASLGQTYRNEDAPANGFEPIEAGDYLAQIIESNVGPTKAGDGTILTLTWEIMEGPLTHRRIWDRLNISNPNPQAQAIAQRALAQICDAVGLPGVSDSEELHFKPVRLKVGIQVDKTGNYGPKNQVSKYTSASGAPPAQKSAPGAQAQSQARPAQQVAPAQRAAGQTRPWGQRASA